MYFFFLVPFECKLFLVIMDDVSIVENIDCLPDSYVQYELLIRQQNLPDSTMRMRKRALIEILKRERDENRRMLMVPHMPLEDDLVDCKVLLDCVADDMQIDLRGNANRCEVQLNFLRMRLERLAPSPLRALADKRIELLEYIEVLVKCFANVSVASGLDVRPNAKSSTNVTGGFLSQLNSITFEPTPVAQAQPSSSLVVANTGPQPNPQVHNSYAATYHLVNGIPTRRISVEAVGAPNSSAGVDVNQASSASAAVSNVTPGSQSTAFPPDRAVVNGSLQSGAPNFSQFSLQHHVRSNAEMWKWRISFSGPDDTQSANSFLMKLNDLATSRNVNPEEVLRGMPDILTGTAEKWFRTNKHKFTDYAVFSRLFLQDFEPSWNAVSRMDLLRTHLQQPDERIVSFFAYVENEFLTMPECTPMDEQVRITRKLLLPTYIYGLAGRSFKTMDELKNACRELEAGFEIIRSQETMRSQNGAQAAVPIPEYARPPPANSQRVMNGVSSQNSFPRQQFPAPNQNNPQQFNRSTAPSSNNFRQSLPNQLSGNGNWNHPIGMSHNGMQQNQIPAQQREYRREFIPNNNSQNSNRPQQFTNSNPNFQSRTATQSTQPQTGGNRGQFPHQFNGGGQQNFNQPSVQQQSANQFNGQQNRGASTGQRYSQGYQSFSQNLNGQNSGDRTFTQSNSNLPRNVIPGNQTCAMNSAELQTVNEESSISNSVLEDTPSSNDTTPTPFGGNGDTQNTSVDMSLSTMLNQMYDQTSEN